MRTEGKGNRDMEDVDTYRKSSYTHMRARVCVEFLYNYMFDLSPHNASSTCCTSHCAFQPLFPTYVFIPLCSFCNFYYLKKINFTFQDFFYSSVLETLPFPSLTKDFSLYSIFFNLILIYNL